ncbi:MAG: enoyl-CoA hydratase/carnithine racemase [Cellvibrionaceae bacterium]|jgi:enoyl-CoA hydratase/carnithine racemase
MENSNNPILVEQKDAILRIQFNRPDKKNALTFDMYDTVTAALQQADDDPTVKVVYLTGTDHCFTAGNDLDDFLNRPVSDSDEPGAAGRFIKQISVTKTPIVAAVSGVAVGVGATMLLHCDLVYASTKAMIMFAFIDLGVVPEAASSYLLPLTVGPRRAAELFMLNERVGGQAAFEMGLVNGVTSPEELQMTAWAKAEALAQKPAEALKDTKMLLRRGHAAIVADQMAFEGQIFDARVRSDETRAILAAFLSK